jgi:hypothetical protein
VIPNPLGIQNVGYHSGIEPAISATQFGHLYLLSLHENLLSSIFFPGAKAYGVGTIRNPPSILFSAGSWNEDYFPQSPWFPFKKWG